jgi:hypothetical protein
MQRQHSAMLSISRQLVSVLTALLAAQLTFASTTDVALAADRIKLAEKGTVLYSSLSGNEKILLFRKYEKECKRKVTYSKNKTIDALLEYRTPLIMISTFSDL